MSEDRQLPLQIQALLNRLQARFGSGVADAAATLLAAAEGAPALLSREWQLFWQEVELEAERLARGAEGNDDGSDHAHDAADAQPVPSSRDPQDLIDSLRARVAALSHSLDA